MGIQNVIGILAGINELSYEILEEIKEYKK